MTADWYKTAYRRNVVVIKLWAQIKLTMHFIIWDRENRIKAEINKLEAEDL